jgi:hypothetical protein
MDLNLTSPLSFKFQTKLSTRMDRILVVGDTRTRKSDGRTSVRHTGQVSGWRPAIAGLLSAGTADGRTRLGGYMGSHSPNDRRLIVIDELSGLHPRRSRRCPIVQASGMA